MKPKLSLLLLLATPFLSLAQNVGINNNAPKYPLSFDGNLGDKISLWTDGTPTHYGFGIQSSLLQMFTKTSSDNIVFGYGSSNSFTERMRVVNAGESGMELKGRITLRNGTSPLDINYGTGIWLFKADNSGLLGFMGVQNNQNIGFFGGPAGWGLTYNGLNSRVGIGNNDPNAPLAFAPSLGKKITLYPGATGDVGFGVAGNRLQIYSDNPYADVAIGYDAAGTFNERFAVKANGALAVNGNTGNAGQVLQSNGSGSAATWTSYATATPQLVSSNSLASCVNNGPQVDVPGLSATITLAAPARVAFYIVMNLKNQGCFGCGAGYTNVRVVKASGSGSPYNTELMVVTPNYEWIGINTGPMLVDLPAGTHTYKVTIQDHTANGSGAEAYTYGGTLIWQIFPL